MDETQKKIQAVCAVLRQDYVVAVNAVEEIQRRLRIYESLLPGGGEDGAVRAVQAVQAVQQSKMKGGRSRTREAVLSVFTATPGVHSVQEVAKTVSAQNPKIGFHAALQSVYAMTVKGFLVRVGHGQYKLKDAA